jgi:hypothetical protein
MTETLYAAVHGGVPFQGQLNTRFGVFRKIPDHGWQFEPRGDSGRAVVIKDPALAELLDRKVS